MPIILPNTEAPMFEPHAVKTLRPLRFPNPGWNEDEHKRASRHGLLIQPDGYLRKSGSKLERVHRFIMQPAGHVHTRHDAYMLCVHGEALPVDSTAKEICDQIGMTEQSIRAELAAKVAFEKAEYNPETGEKITDHDDDE